MIPPSVLDQSSEDSSFEGFDQSSPAQAYARRQQQRTIRRCDGTENFKPVTAATKVGMQESPSAKFLSAGIPGFGDNEAAGKILPCHRVADDGLMRIKPDTLDDLLDGKFDNKINNYYVIDCRFDYEYNGGHIEGAININSTARLEQELLGLLRPKPTVSGDNVKQTVLVFHCEFSAKRAPTFAKHLRQKDRAMNNHNYPRIHYPELYILEGGYSEYFKSSKSHRKPTTYTPMDDPAHAQSRREDLDQFRKAKFGRHKSYAYGDAMSKGTTSLKPAPQLKRNTAPSGPPSMFAAANAARTRRSGSGGSGKGAGLHTLAEDGNTTAAEETDVDIGDSPCPPPSKATTLKIRKPRALSRAETYGPGRMPLQY
ncbi:Rhodanese-like protein [Schizophyllum commune H4-8]|uniref:M-phase inducer phosphatase n=1 Tax=Schizophyllum commune (strain H4-8 / FGSC 9210) TaxID=578458 RepID=D8PWL8_SCHCM|nr:Rhodanese-like protein [Schizophyllum commune H4-8]KAI5899901.1 Rhodanese-like protein [Schizophyllum commune H4-8]